MSFGNRPPRKSNPVPRGTAARNAQPRSSASNSPRRQPRKVQPGFFATCLAFLQNLYGAAKNGFSHFWKKINNRFDPGVLKLGLIALAAVLLLGCGGYGVYRLATNKNGQAVYLDGQSVGVIKLNKNKTLTADELKTLAVKKLEQDLGTPVQVNEAVTTELVRVPSKELVTEDHVVSEICKGFTYLVQAAFITVNGQQLAIVQTEQEATEILDSIQHEYLQSDLEIESIEFVEDVQVTLDFVETDQLDSKAHALELLRANTEEEELYTIQDGDSLGQIAVNAGMTLNDLLAINPTYDITTRLRPGNTLTLKVSKPLVSVLTKERIVYIRVVPKPVDIRYNANEHTSHSAILQQGRDGQEEVTAFIVRVNKIETGQEIIEQKELLAPIIEIQERGTSNVPPRRAIGSFIMPAKGRLTDTFGSRGGSHDGIDIANSKGTPIYASDGGIVIKAGNRGDGYGNNVVIDHGNGFVTYYAHNSQILVSVGQAVAQGEKIALMGSTGNSSGNHCHFEVHLNGVPKNPFDYVR